MVRRAPHVGSAIEVATLVARLAVRPRAGLISPAYAHVLARIRDVVSLLSHGQTRTHSEADRRTLQRQSRLLPKFASMATGSSHRFAIDDLSGAARDLDFPEKRKARNIF